jgi:tetratricopeptide (TPR) repeat protein
VVFYIPVIPLGKKQILDLCPNCKRHRVSSLKQWQQAEADSLRKAMQEAEADPDDPAKAIELHRTMVAFRRDEEAARLAEMMLVKFPHDVDVQLHLGNWYIFQGSLAESRACFATALELEPENLEAKRMVAMACIDSGDLNRARELLRGMDTPGPHQDPLAMRVLGDAYQDRGDHAEALEMYKAALQMSPALAQDKPLRKRIQISEKALGRTESVMPKLKRRYGRVYAGLILAAASIIGVWAYNFYQAKHQALYIVNRLNAPVNVSIDDQLNCTVPAGARQRLVLAEGAHRAVIQPNGKAPNTVDFQIQNGFLERFSDRTAFVLNPGGAATLLWEEIAYIPKDVHNPPQNVNPYRIYFGENFYTIRNVDYIFQKAPRELSLDKGANKVTKTQLAVLDLEPAEIFRGFPSGTPLEQMANFAEHHLRLTPENEQLLQDYTMLMLFGGQTDRCREFLAGGLEYRPVIIEWHRRYQQLYQMAGRQAALVDQYQKLLSADPHNSALLYLLGRIVTQRKQAEQYFHQAIEADPENAYPYLALAFNCLSRGDFQNAESFAQKACRLKPDHKDMVSMFYDVRFALGKHAQLETELRKKQSEQPLNFDVHRCLLQVLMASGSADAAEREHEAYAQRVREATSGDPAQLILRSQLALQYLKHDLQGLLNNSNMLIKPDDIALEGFMIHIEQGNPQEAEAAFAAVPDYPGKELYALLLSLAWSEKGEPQKAAQWRTEAIKTLSAGDDNDKLAAALLQKNDCEIDQLDDVVFTNKYKAVWLAALADVCPDKRAELLQYAAKLNTDTFFPHAFLQRVISDVK